MKNPPMNGNLNKILLSSIGGLLLLIVSGFGWLYSDMSHQIDALRLQVSTTSQAARISSIEATLTAVKEELGLVREWQASIQVDRIKRGEIIPDLQRRVAELERQTKK